MYFRGLFLDCVYEKGCLADKEAAKCTVRLIFAGKKKPNTIALRIDKGE